MYTNFTALVAYACATGTLSHAPTRLASAVAVLEAYINTLSTLTLDPSFGTLSFDAPEIALTTLILLVRVQERGSSST